MKLIYEKSQPGRRGLAVPTPELPVNTRAPHDDAPCAMLSCECSLSATMYSASAEARKTAAPAMSSGCPIRPSGTASLTWRFFSPTGRFS